MEIPIDLLFDKVKFCYRYVDYAKDQWTVPVLMTEERFEKIRWDKSLVQIKIITDKQEWILDVK